jgi:prevent-host-death family protein
MAWSVAAAKQRLSELLRNAAEEPQTIESRSRPVAGVVAADEFLEFEAWRSARRARSVGDAFAELRALTAGAGYRLHLPTRKDRRNDFRLPGR